MIICVEENNPRLRGDSNWDFSDSVRLPPLLHCKINGSVGARHAVPGKRTWRNWAICRGRGLCTAGLWPAFLNLIPWPRRSNHERHVHGAMDGARALVAHSGTACRAPTEETSRAESQRRRRDAGGTKSKVKGAGRRPAVRTAMAAAELAARLAAAQVVHRALAVPRLARALLAAAALGAA